jgi:type VI secretion system protein ImpE
MEAPEDLRDMVWMPAHLQFANGGEMLALLPARYAGSESAADGLIALGRKTVWEELAPDTHRGLGQRIITTDVADVPLLEVRTLVVRGGGAATASGAVDG